jgi:hypothetical protein
MKQFPDSTDSDFTRRLMDLNLANYEHDLARYLNAASNLTLEYVSSMKSATSAPTAADNDRVRRWQKEQLMPAFIRGIPKETRFWKLHEKQFASFSDCTRAAHKLNAELNFGKAVTPYSTVASIGANAPAANIPASRPRTIAASIHAKPPSRLLRSIEKTPSNTSPCPLDNRCPDYNCTLWHNLSRAKRFDSNRQLRPASETAKIPISTSTFRYRSAASGANSDPVAPRKECSHCKRPGHTHDDCYRLHPDRRPAAIPSNVQRAT